MARQLRHRGKLEEDERRLVRNLVKLAKWQERTLLVQGRKEAREAWAEACEEMHANGGRGAHRFRKVADQQADLSVEVASGRSGNLKERIAAERRRWSALWGGNRQG